jgi:hypothetical protein
MCDKVEVALDIAAEISIPVDVLAIVGDHGVKEGLAGRIDSRIQCRWSRS